MSKIRIKEFGPITEGYEENEGFLDIQKVTVFIGNQGSGKSSVTKLVSTMSWLEKALYRGEIKESYVTRYNRFVNEYCNYQNLKNYFREGTEITYIGKGYHLDFKNGKLSVHKTKADGYKVPKIMYVPAERNFLSAVDNPDKLRGLPRSLSTFWEEMQRSLVELSGSIPLPIGNVRFEYDKSNKISRVVGEKYRLRLSEASSGFQSFIPLFLVSRNLTQSMDREPDTSKSALSSADQRKLRSEVEKILSNTKLSKELKEAALEILSSKYRNDSFLNIVEEIEQNLFPSSQKDILFTLLEYANHNEYNGLILTTHSPYIINYLTLAIQANFLKRKIEEIKGEQRDVLTARLERVVPLKSCIPGADAIFYQLTDNGIITRLPDYEGLPSDHNYLNSFLMEGNVLFDELLAIEEEL